MSMRYRSPLYYFYLFYFIFYLNAFVNYFFIALCVATLVFELFINMIIVWSFFILLVGVSICFHSYKVYIFKAPRPNNTKDALKEYCAVIPLDYIMLP